MPSVVSEGQAEKLLGKVSQSQLQQAKDAVRGVDMTSVSTEQLAEIGAMLFQSGVVSDEVAGVFISGNMEFDANGKQKNRDVKFNALDFFEKSLRATQSYVSIGGESTKHAADVLSRANNVLNALAYFANSADSSLSVDTRA